MTRWALGASLAACEACRALGAGDVEVRWPNDLYHEGRKLAGTLLELRTSGSVVQELIVGTGFNANHGESDFPVELRGRATSLRAATGALVDREHLVAGYLRRLDAAVARLEGGRWEEIRERWEALAPGAHGSSVRITPGRGGGFAGTTRGVDTTGALRVEHPDGGVVAIRLGDSVTWLWG